MRMIRFVFLVILIGNVLSVSAANKGQRFGTIDKANLKVEVCPIDSNAHAFYIFDTGLTEFFLEDHFKLRSTSHFRIKILDETALDYASIEIPLYTSGRDSEKLNFIKATTYNLEGGKLVESKMSRGVIIYDEVSEQLTLAKFSLPNVKAGSIIEVKYSFSSDFIYNLNTWAFQHTIPVLKTNFIVDIPEYFTYKRFPHGYIHIDFVESTSTSTMFIGNETVEYQVHRSEYSAADVPAFPESEYLSAVKNYISNIEFELARFEIPGIVHEDYTSTWSKINSKLLTHSKFGSVLNNDRCYSKVAATMASLDPVSKMNSSFKYVKSHTKWNGNSSCYTSHSLKETMNTHVGNCADINLSLVALLRKTGLEAYPVALSTRANGFINSYFPSATSLNYIVALCLIDGESYLMDATNDYTSIDLLPMHCLNGEGLVVAEDSYSWVSLQGKDCFSASHNYTLELHADGLLTGYKISKLDSYAAYIKRNQIADVDDDEKFIEGIEDDNQGLTINDHSFINVDSLDKKVRIKLDVSISDHVTIVNDLMYMKPLLYEGWYTNPLKLEERLYPVEYAYPLSEVCAVRVMIPKGYVVESLPSPISCKIQDGSCSFKFAVSEIGGMVSIVSHIKRKELIFPYTEYQDLKAFYEQIVIKHNEQIVFKKI